MYHGAEADEGDAYVSVFATVDDADTVCLGTFQFNDGTDGWHRHVIDLHQYAGKNNVTFQFYAYTADGSAALYIDNVRLDQFAAKDLAVETAGIPYRMTTGDKASQVTARVINEGSETSGSYTVDVVKNGTVVATQDGEPWPSTRQRILPSMSRTPSPRPETQPTSRYASTTTTTENSRTTLLLL